MTLFKRLFNELFDSESAVKEQEKEILVDEPIRPTMNFFEDYRQWKSESYHIGLLDHLKELYAIRQSNPQAEVLFHLHDSDGCKGFYFSQESPWTKQDYQFITHYFKEIILAEGYRLQNSRRLAVSEDEELQQTDRYYFKLPLRSRKEVPYPQSWGNLNLEHKSIDEKTIYVKLMANTYHDRNFQAPKDFDSLINRLFSS